MLADRQDGLRPGLFAEQRGRLVHDAQQPLDRDPPEPEETFLREPAYTISFMYSYPNMIPLDEQTVRRIVAAVEPLAFTQLYGGWKQVVGDAKTAVRRSAERYIAHLRGEGSR